MTYHHHFRLALTLAALAILLASPAIGKEIIGEHLYDRVLLTPHPYFGAPNGRTTAVWEDHFAFPRAKYLVFQFSRFELEPGDWVEITTVEGVIVQRLEGRGFKNRGGDFISKMVPGEEAYITLYSSHPRPAAFGYEISRISRGFSDVELAERQGRATCGTNDQQDAICFQASHPAAYRKSRAVCRIVMDGSAMCTGWLVSCENHLLTNNHCTWDDDDFDTQAELDRMEFQFMYQDATCGGGSPTWEYSFQGGTWLDNHHNLDYTLIQAPEGEDPVSTYGFLNIDYRLVPINEQIYIPGHPSGRPKEISLYSTHAQDQSGSAEVYSQSEPACVGGTVGEIGYYADTEGGNSGSPVLSRVTDKVVALHHCADCPNRGVRIQDVYDEIQAGPSPLPYCSRYGEHGTLALDQESYGCASTIGIKLRDENLAGLGTASVSIWSVSEPSPETVVLTESAILPGYFAGTITTTGGAAVHGDNMISTGQGETVSVRYVDANDGHGGVNVNRDDSALVDCTAPVISAIEVTGITTQAATITWTTDEPAHSVVEYWVDPSGTPELIMDGALVTSHSVPLAGLQDCTIYDFLVRSADAAGNTAEDDNGGDNYSFLTDKNVVSFADGMESGVNGWTHESGTGIDDWQQVTDFSHSSTHSWWASDPAEIKDAWLITPDIDIVATSRLRFWQKYNLESGFDGGVLEISTDGGSNWADLGAAITQNPYNKTLSTSYSNPIGGRQAWSGTADWQEVIVTLAAYGPDSVKIRFRIGCDNGVAKTGWWIDDFEISNSEPCDIPVDGDVNGDHVFDSNDVMLLAGYLAGDGVTLTDPDEADRDNNGILDAQDLHLLLVALNSI